MWDHRRSGVIRASDEPGLAATAGGDMNIKGLNGSLGAYQAQMNRTGKADVGRAQAGSERSQTTGQAGDRISVSPDAALRTSAFSTAMSAADVRQEKVDSIKQSLDNGTYTIDSRKIATKLVLDERAIFGK